MLLLFTRLMSKIRILQNFTLHITHSLRKKGSITVNVKSNNIFIYIKAKSTIQKMFTTFNFKNMCIIICQSNINRKLSEKENFIINWNNKYAGIDGKYFVESNIQNNIAKIPTFWNASCIAIAFVIYRKSPSIELNSSHKPTNQMFTNEFE